jgi:hypothetical protein
VSGRNRGAGTDWFADATKGVSGLAAAQKTKRAAALTPVVQREAAEAVPQMKGCSRMGSLQVHGRTG